MNREHNSTALLTFTPSRSFVDNMCILCLFHNSFVSLSLLLSDLVYVYAALRFSFLTVSLFIKLISFSLFPLFLTFLTPLTPNDL
jgi:hypothetical protein